MADHTIPAEPDAASPQLFAASPQLFAASPQLFAAAPDPVDRPPPIPIKIVIGGGFGAGKTTGISVLSEIDPVVTEAAMTAPSAAVDVAPEDSRKTATTVAMDFGRLTLDESLVLYLFGTPGQERFGFMWPKLCAGALGGIVMVDSSRIADCFVAIDYFEKLRLPFVVAVNQFDGRDKLSLDDVRAATDVDPDIPVLGVDARDHQSMRGAALRLLDLILARAKSAE
jgi:signal recognition particle receptor subunit beta